MIIITERGEVKNIIHFTDYVASLPKEKVGDFTYSLSDAEKEAVSSGLGKRAKGAFQEESIEKYVSFLKKDFAFPDQIATALEKFTLKGNSAGGYLFKNLPLDNIHGFQKEGFLSELVVLAFASKIGNPYGYASQRNGEVIQNLIPKKEDAEKQLGTGSVELVWHTEDAHTNLNCDYIALLCLRGDAEAATLLSCINPEELDPVMRKSLESKEYIINSDGSYEKASENKTSVIGYQNNKMILKYDPLYTHCLKEESKAALDYLTEYINSKAMSIYLETGDLLLVDNNSSVHARTLYHPRYDDTDRWLKRVAVLQKSVPEAAKVKGKEFVINI